MEIKIPQIEPWIGNEELQEVSEAIKSTWVTESTKTKRFEEMFRNKTGSKYARAFFNGTVSLFTALKVLGIKEGDEVITSDFTFAATLNPIIMCGAKPVLVDIETKTFNIDPDKIEPKITTKTKAIMPVHIYGQAADMEKIMGIAKKHNLYVIEDAAQGVGVTFMGKHVGTFGNVGSFSFYGNKTITTGEGGMLVTDNEGLDKKFYAFKNHGRMTKGFVHDGIGMNFCVTEMQAALGIAQLEKLEEIIRRKKNIREIYMNELKGVKGIKFAETDLRCSPVFWFTSILVENPSYLEEELKKKGIQTRRFFYPMHLQPCYKDFGFGKDFPNAEYAYNHGLSLPSSATLSESQLAEVCNAIKEIMKK